MRLFIAFLVVFAMGFVTPVIARADEVADDSIQVVQDEPAIEALDDSEGDGYPLSLTTQDTNNVIAQYPQVANAILRSYVTRDAEPIDLSSTDLDFWGVQEIVHAILGQHPELIDVSTDFSFANKQFTPEYLFNNSTDDEIMAMRQKMAREITHAMSWIPANGSDLQKAKAAHDFLVAHVIYDHGTEDAHNTDHEPWTSDGGGVYGRIITNGIDGRFYPYCAYGPIAEHNGVCEGISYAFKLLMDKCGIECKIVENPAAGHAWNHVKVDGSWYNVDVTWDLDDEYQYGNYVNKIYSVINNDYWSYFEPGLISYNYFLKSDTYISDYDQSKGITTHVNYDPYDHYDDATDTSYDATTHNEWKATAPLPNAKTKYITKTEAAEFVLSTTALDLAVGDSHQLKVGNVLPHVVNPLVAQWTSSDPSVAYVCADGTVVALKEGIVGVKCVMGDTDIDCLADRTEEYVERQCVVTVGNGGVEATFTSAQLLLGEQLKMVYWLTVPEGVDVTGGTAEFRVGGRNSRTISVDLADATFDQTKNRYGFPFELSSVEMAQTITCTFSSGGTGNITKEYSVKEYVQAALGSDLLTDIEKACVRAVANYGRYMQRYLSQKTEPGWTIGQEYEEMDVFYEGANVVEFAKQAVQQYAPVKTGLVNAWCSLILDSYTTLDVSIKPTGDKFSAKGTFGNKTYTAVKQDDGKYHIRVDRIKAADLATTLTVTGQESGEDFTIVAQPLSYAYIVLNGPEDQTANEAMASLYYYYAMAKALKGSTS